MIIVTGSEGFIGKNLVKKLQDLRIIGVVGLDTKHATLDEIYDFLYLHVLDIKYIFHLGAITDTTEMDRNRFDEYNVNCSMFIWNLCSTHNIPLIYASSAATYGDGSLGFNDEEDIIKLSPLNPYGWSKQQFDVWAGMNESFPPKWYGLKFFNVYGYGESHKGKMASVAYHMFNQIKDTGIVKLFKSHHQRYKDGEQLRDFIYIDDIIDVCVWLYNNKPESGYYNVGTGKARSFNDLASAVFNSLNLETKITYFDTPLKLRDKYQYYTQAKMEKLRKAGYTKPFTELEEGVDEYINKLKKESL